ncbi:MAG: CarD family transcriptional regulator [Lachnospiraceae bacterium]|nr:CarD family transcriptional regulator [Lachnospiraceae bacterium]
MFKIGDFIVYGHNGICRVEDITHLDMSGVDKDRLYYVLLPMNTKGGKVYSPVDSNKIQTRKMLTEQEAHALIDEIPEIEQLWITNDKLREEQYKEVVKGCDCRQWIRIIKTLYLRKEERLAQGKKVTSIDEHYLKLAENQLYGELSIVLGMKKGEMEDFIVQRVGRVKVKES